MSPSGAASLSSELERGGEPDPNGMLADSSNFVTAKFPVQTRLPDDAYSPNYLTSIGPAMLSSCAVKPVDPDAPPKEDSGGLLGRWNHLKVAESSKRIVDCAAAQSQFRTWDFLKPQNYSSGQTSAQLNYLPSSNIRETRFHRGFQRRMKCDIAPDAPRLAREMDLEAKRDYLMDLSAEVTKDMKEKVTFNVLTGEGRGRESEFRKTGKRILNPSASMPTIFMEHDKDALNRQRSSTHRFFEHPAPQKPPRTANLVQEGLFDTERASMIIGYGDGAPRTKYPSYGVADNYAHLRGNGRPAQWEQGVHKTKSQIVFG